MKHCLHFCSTPRNVFLSLGQAIKHPHFKHHLLLIDQAANKPVPLFETLAKCDSPFSTVITLFKGSGYLGKRRARKQAFKVITKLCADLRPSRVYVGNDRRLEFQFCMYQLLRQGSDCDAVYLEDGINSYLRADVIRKKMRPLADRIFEPVLKKFSYGSWYDRGEFVGCSRWIAQRLLTFPELLSDDKGPQVGKLAPQDYQSSQFTKAMLTLLQHSSVEVEEYHGDLLLLLPHSQDLLADQGSFQAFIQKLKPLLDRSGSTYVKYHPNEEHFILNELATPLPHKLPAETLLGISRFKHYIGDTSAALLSVKWLNPQVNVVSVSNDKPSSKPLFDLMRKVGIKVVASYQDIHL